MQELCLGIGLALWACLLLALPVADQSWPGLGQLLSILPRVDDPALVYAALAWLTGGAQIVGALFGRSAVRRAAAIAAFTAWAFIACGLIGHTALVPAIAAYAALALLNIRAALGKTDDA
ncbi:hypothetical protein AA0535_1760 [Asaia krungthepensis NRIC 0535]|uniref:Uncharacterized protein n=2 Tax=Asaia krungthepensis TaxID=220990 RepID=A0ABQ0Q387_9PROT|nr:hypothetical protein AA0535_1760 [Asaia krungthepensis NRIC 0535]